MTSTFYLENPRTSGGFHLSNFSTFVVVRYDLLWYCKGQRTFTMSQSHKPLTANESKPDQSNFSQLMHRVTKYSAGVPEELHLVAIVGNKASYSRAEHGGGLLVYEFKEGEEPLEVEL